MFLMWLVCMVVLIVVTVKLERNPWVFGAFGIIATPVISIVMLMVWHYMLDAD